MRMRTSCLARLFLVSCTVFLGYLITLFLHSVGVL